MKNINGDLFILMMGLFVVMMSYGVLMPVFPFLIESFMVTPVSRQDVALHFGLLIAIYPLTLVFAAPLWGRIADKYGPKIPILLGLLGFTIMQVIIIFSATLTMLYVARILGSLLSSFLIPVIIANISAITPKPDRTKAMAWAGTAISAGVVVGPGIGGLLIQSNLHLRLNSIHIMFNRFSVPFLVLAILGTFTFAITLAFLENKKQDIIDTKTSKINSFFPPGKWQSFKKLLLLSLIIQLGITSFESVFPLFIKDIGKHSVAFVSTGLVICGLVMAILQPVIAKWGYIIIKNAEKQIAVGFMIIGVALPMFTFSDSKIVTLIVIGFFGLGASMVIPNLLALVSLKDDTSSGWAIGMQSSFGGIGQILGPLIGTALCIMNPSIPFYITGLLLTATSFVGLKKFFINKSKLIHIM